MDILDADVTKDNKVTLKSRMTIGEAYKLAEEGFDTVMGDSGMPVSTREVQFIWDKSGFYKKQRNRARWRTLHQRFSGYRVTRWFNKVAYSSKNHFAGQNLKKLVLEAERQLEVENIRKRFILNLAKELKYEVLSQGYATFNGYGTLSFSEIHIVKKDPVTSKIHEHKFKDWKRLYGLLMYEKTGFITHLVPYGTKRGL